MANTKESKHENGEKREENLSNEYYEICDKCVVVHPAINTFELNYGRNKKHNSNCLIVERRTFIAVKPRRHMTSTNSNLCDCGCVIVQLKNLLETNAQSHKVHFAIRQNFIFLFVFLYFALSFVLFISYLFIRREKKSEKENWTLFSWRVLQCTFHSLNYAHLTRAHTRKHLLFIESELKPTRQVKRVENKWISLISVVTKKRSAKSQRQ